MDAINEHKMIFWGGEGPVFHLAHANSYHPGVYLPLISKLLPHFSVYSILFRPFHEGEDPSSINSFRPFRNDLLKGAEASGWQNIYGFGHSLGALVTMMAANKKPELFKKVILVEPPIIPSYVFPILNILPYSISKWIVPPSKTALKRRHKWSSREEAFNFFRSKKVFEGFSDEALRHLVEFGITENEDGAYRLAYSKEWESKIYCSISNPWPLIKKMETPALCIRGGMTDVITEAYWEKWQRKQNNAIFKEIPMGGHLLPFEFPELLAEWIIALKKEG